MIKLVYCLRRLPQLSLEEFQSHWLEHHSHFGFLVKSIRRYVQYHAPHDDPSRAEAARKQLEPYDGVAIAWFDDVAGMQAALKSAESAAAVEDERLFIDHSRSSVCLTREEVLVAPQGKVPYVFFRCYRRRSDIDRRTFSERWLQQKEKVVRAHEAGLLMGYIQNHTVLENDQLGTGSLGQDGPWDGVLTAYFDSIIKFKVFLCSTLAQEMFAQERAFTDHSRSIDILTRRYVIKDLIR
ncbi:MAG: EthD domain-containing protein [Terriglobales bacterium]